MNEETFGEKIRLRFGVEGYARRVGIDFRLAEFAARPCSYVVRQIVTGQTA